MNRIVMVGLAVVVVAGAVAAGAAIGANRNDDKSAPTTTPTAPTTPPAVGALVAGGGGSAKATDGKTPIRFASTCDGAAQAAAAYSISLTDEVGYARPGVAGKKRPGLKATLDYIFNTGGTPDPSVVERRAIALTPNQTLPGLVAHPEWGGYRVADCVPKFSATVNLFSCLTGYPDSDGAAICDASIWELTWFADDWHISRIPATGVSPDPTSVFPDSVKAPNPVTAELRRAGLAAGGAGWTEWANAPR